MQRQRLRNRFPSGEWTATEVGVFFFEAWEIWCFLNVNVLYSRDSPPYRRDWDSPVYFGGRFSWVPPFRQSSCRCYSEHSTVMDYGKKARLFFLGCVKYALMLLALIKGDEHKKKEEKKAAFWLKFSISLISLSFSKYKVVYLLQRCKFTELASTICLPPDFTLSKPPTPPPPQQKIME